MYSATEAQSTSSGTSGFFVDRYISLWGFPPSTLSPMMDYNRVCFKDFHTIYERLDLNKTQHNLVKYCKESMTHRFSVTRIYLE